MENKSFELYPVGRICLENQFTAAKIMPDYRPALLYLELFSHLILFLDGKNNKKLNNPESNINSNAENSNRSYELINGNGIYAVVAKILQVNEKKGIILLDYADALDGTFIYDIKPYFPCEDRVKEFYIPDFMKEWHEWRQDKEEEVYDSGKARIYMNEAADDEDKARIYMNEAADGKDIAWTHNVKAINGNDIAPLYKDESADNIKTIFEIGQIRKKDGECLIELKKENVELLNSLKAYSHIKILWWFNRFEKSIYRREVRCNPPYENAPRTGIFATRSPVRPNPIAMTTAKILNIDIKNRRIRISGTDAFDKSPVTGIIPYIPAFDRVKAAYVPEWLKHWPEWLDDREALNGYEILKISNSEPERLQSFMEVEVQSTGKVISRLSKDNKYIKDYTSEIIVRGARQNNLKNINISIPKNKITVITGVSGSGKSSLAFDTIYAESQRRLFDIMSGSGIMPDQMTKPDFDQITGLPPAIAIDQKNVGRNPRSTVGTMTDLYDYFRLLFSKTGIRHCPDCGRAITPLKEEEIIDLLAKLKKGTILDIRAFTQEKTSEVFEVPDHDCQEYKIYLKEIRDSIKRGISLGNGAITVTINHTEDFLFQTRNLCYHCSHIFFELTPASFSFNNPDSMCPVCKGLGVKLEVDAGLIVSSPELSILDGASKWWGDLRKFRKKPNANWMRGEILGLAEEMEVDLELPWNELPQDFKHQALYGSESREIRFIYENTNGRRGEIVRPVEGAYNTIVRLFRENNGETAARIAAAFMREKPCSACQGERLSAEGRYVSIAGTRFPETVTLTLEELKKWIVSLLEKLTKEQLETSLPILDDLDKKLDNLIEAGVPYLTLDRSVPTLSAGELQRIRLASRLGGGISNILYILDEPSMGLHPKDHNRLINLLKHIKEEGNTILIVEHDADTMLAADKIIDIGPGAGTHGGFVIAEGSPQEIMQNPNSVTGKYLTAINNQEALSAMNSRKPYGWLKLNGARCNNLKNINAEFPLGVFTCITGVSGSGKSSLIFKTLYPALAKYLNGSENIPGDYDNIEGLDNIDSIICISQQPIGRTPRSNPATYTGVFDDIRNLYATTDAAKSKGYKRSRFSFNSKEGQCEVCQGEGKKRIEMQFMPDVWIECSVCHGKRYNKEALEINYKGKTIADVLDMNIEEALDFFPEDKKISGILKILCDVGLGYIKLGQSALTLSGGEAQRVKLAKELSRTDTGKTVFLMDEPTTGLHYSDVIQLLHIFNRLTQSGNTVIAIEHNVEVMKAADWIIDIGPEGGNAGGHIIAQGTPKEVASCRDSYTGIILNKLINNKL